jgi:hypothetical protein
LDDWMDLHRLSDGEDIKNSNPTFNAELLKDMQDETRAFFNAVVQDNKPLASLFNMKKTWASRRLAEHYDGAQQPLWESKNSAPMLDR